MPPNLSLSIEPDFSGSLTNGELTINTLAQIAAHIEALGLGLSPAAIRELAANIHATRAAAGPEEQALQAQLDALN